MTDRPRLIEVAFPLKQTSIDSVHEKNVRHGHISTLHIWPARRPLAAARAALIATLLPDPGDKAERDKILEKIGGKVVTNEKTGKEETEGGILHWGRESNPDMDWFREKIKEAYGGRAPRVLDPFSGGGAIPLEAMRLGCEVTAVDINPVAWFILKCTLEYPQKLAGKKLPLPKFAMEMPSFRAAWEAAQLKEGKKKGGKQKAGTRDMWESATPEVDLAWHVRAWGHWVLERARKDLERFYPVVDNKPSVAYLWARTVRCKACGATLPLLKTRWLCNKKGKRFVLDLKPRQDRSGVQFDIIQPTVAQANNDKKLTEGTMSRSGAQCPCCPAIMTSEDIRLEAQAGRLGATVTAVVVEGKKGKEYRPPSADDLSAAEVAMVDVEKSFDKVPFGIPREPLPRGGSRVGGGSPFTVYLYGRNQWHELFNPRQLITLGVITSHVRAAAEEMMRLQYSPEMTTAIVAYLYATMARVADRNSELCTWQIGAEKVGHTFARFALPITWDYVEIMPWADSSGGYLQALEWVGLVVGHLTRSLVASPTPTVLHRSATEKTNASFDVILTDPPYYDAIPYSDLMDFFYIWLRRIICGISPELDMEFGEALSPKWDHKKDDGELIDDASRFEGNKDASKNNYERGMERAFRSCRDALTPEGRLVIVFAHKQPDAWETLVAAIVRAGFVVDGSWPIQTERTARTRSLSSAALSSSVWLVCKKRPDISRPGWDNRVLDDMRERMQSRLRDYWDAGLRGPDFVWAATGPALEAYSKHPVVKKANEPGQVMTVAEFLRQVRRIVVDFVVGRVLTGDSNGEAVSGLDDVTTYYLLHRHDFGIAEAPAGASILYAVSCGLSDRDLSDRFDLLMRTGGKSAAVEEEPDDEEAVGDDEEEEEAERGGGSGNKVKLKAWDARRNKNLGYDTEGKPAPLIDQLHRLMLLWRTGEQAKVDQYLDARALWKSQIFHQILQAIIELAPEGSEERALLESISNHVGVRGKSASKQISLPTTASE